MGSDSPLPFGRIGCWSWDWETTDACYPIWDTSGHFPRYLLASSFNRFCYFAMPTNKTKVRRVAHPGPPIAPRNWRWVAPHELLRVGDLCRDLTGNWFAIKPTPAAPKPLMPFLYIRYKSRKKKQ